MTTPSAVLLGDFSPPVSPYCKIISILSCFLLSQQWKH